MKHRVVKWYAESLRMDIYGIEFMTRFGTWVPATSRTFANENDAIKYIKESLRC